MSPRIFFGIACINFFGMLNTFYFGITHVFMFNMSNTSQSFVILLHECIFEAVMSISQVCFVIIPSNNCIKKYIMNVQSKRPDIRVDETKNGFWGVACSWIEKKIPQVFMLLAVEKEHNR